MASERTPDVQVHRGLELQHPNREKSSSKATKATVILLLIVSVVLMLIISIGGWDTIEGAKPVQIFYMLIYLVMAYYIGRWNRGVLPVASALAIILLIFAAVAGPEWFTRDKAGFADPTLDSSLLGLLTLLLVPVQLLLIAFAMRGFTQNWHVELEVPVGQVYRPGEPGAPTRPVTA
jgi:hypothetical protein